MCKSSELFVDIDKVVTICFDSVSLFDFSSGFVMVGSTFCSSFWSCKKSLYFALSEPIKVFYSNWIEFFRNKNSIDRVQVKSFNQQLLPGLYYVSDIFLLINCKNSLTMTIQKEMRAIKRWYPSQARCEGIIIMLRMRNSPRLHWLSAS